MLAIPAGDGNIPVRSAYALTNAILRLHQMGLTWELHMHEFNSLVTGARNGLAKEFLNTDCTHVLWIDSDIIFKAEDFVKLFMWAQHYPMIAAPYITKNKDNPRFVIKNMSLRPNEHGLLAADGIGFGFTCIQRKVFEDIASDPSMDMFATYVERLEDGSTNEVGEDMHFFRMAKNKGYNLFIDPSIRLIHRGIYDYEGDLMEAVRRATRTS